MPPIIPPYKFPPVTESCQNDAAMKLLNEERIIVRPSSSNIASGPPDIPSFMQLVSLNL